jgi:hypothetical protein
MKCVSGFYFISESQISLTLSIIVSQVVSERTVPLLLTGKQNNGHHDALVPIKKEKKVRYF